MKIPTLERTVQIVDETGCPTDYFVRWWNNSVQQILATVANVSTLQGEEAALAQMPVAADAVFFAADDVAPLVWGLNAEIAMLRAELDNMRQGTTL